MYPGRGGYSNREGGYPAPGRGGGYSNRGGRGRGGYDGRSYAHGNNAGGGYGRGNEGFGGSSGRADFSGSGSGAGFGGNSGGDGYGGNNRGSGYGGNRGGFGGSSGAGFGGSSGNGFGGRSASGFDGSTAGFPRPPTSTPANDTPQWPKSEGEFGSGGFGVPIDDSIYLKGFGNAAPQPYLDKQESTNPRDDQNATTRSESGSIARGSTPVPPFGGIVPKERTDYTSPKGRGGRGYGRHQPGLRHNSDHNRRNGTTGWSPTPPVTSENKVDLERVNLFAAKMNDDGGVYTSDEEEKKPSPKKDDKEPSPNMDDRKIVELAAPMERKIVESAAPMPDAPIRQQLNYGGAPRRGRGSHSNQSFRSKPVQKPSPPAEPAKPLDPEEPDAKAEKFADSILLILLADQEMRETLKKHDAELFDQMVKHIAVVALKTA